MIRKLKILGPTLVAVLAMSAVVASAAQAQFTASSYPTTVTATSPLGNDIFTTEGGTVECAGHFEGTLSEASTSIKIFPTYTECKAFGFVSATVHVNGCWYIMYSNEKIDIGCPPTKVIEITAGNCVVDVPPQNNLTGVKFTNNSPWLDIFATAKKIKYNVTKDGFLCPFSGTGEKEGAEYTQESAVTAKPVSGGTSISID
ncbi:MAG TPA: hypothetical protein VLI94_06175 [Solirubrobacterales bacterium]|nr:hypothetical protein [Solirubrobacterales bacterium]